MSLALDELNSFGRASKIQLAVMVDRGHRELPGDGEQILQVKIFTTL